MPRLLTLNNPTNPEATYIIFPPAGSLANFKQGWLTYLPCSSRIIIVEYPGRGIALNDPPITNFNVLAKNICKNILAHMDGTVFFIGESMGGYLAFDIAQTLLFQLKRKVSAILLISVGRADNIGKDMQYLLSLQEQDFDNFILKNIFNNNSPWKNFDKDTQSYFMELLRQDMQVLSTFRYRSMEPLSSLLMIANGISDTHCHSNNTKAFWAKKTKKAFLYFSFLGNHIVTNENAALLLEKFINFYKR